MFHSVDEIHSEKAGDECGEHEDDGDGGECPHRRVHVVVDDAGVCVHRGFKDIGVDRRGFACLRHLDVDVFDKVCVEFVYLQLELELCEEVFVATYGGDEIGE